MLKSLRLTKGWKLAEMAARSGFPISTLSKMENGKLALNYDKLSRLSKALEIDIGTFFAQVTEASTPPPASGRRSITRAGDGQEIETDSYNHLYLATDLLNKRFVPMIAYPHAKTMEEFGDWVRHPGEEYTFIIEGTVDFYCELYAPVRLEQGDSIYFDSSMGHAYLAVGDAPCRGLTICAGEESQVAAMREKFAPLSTDAVSSVVELKPPAAPQVTRKPPAPKKVAAAKGARKVRTGS